MLYNDDCIKIMKTLPSDSIDMIFADPPYFLSNGGVSIKSGKVVSVDKGEWDKVENYDNIDKFTHEWINECFRLLKNNSTIWISGTHHNIFDVERIMKKVGFKIINIIIWEKTDPPPLIYKNKFRFSYEFIIWAKKGNSYYFNYNLMFQQQNKEMSDIWKLPAVSTKEKTFGYHPTQKPECLLKRIILCSTKEGDTVLDPFMGSGTTCAVAKNLKRKYIGVEKENKFFRIAKKRCE